MPRSVVRLINLIAVALVGGLERSAFLLTVTVILLCCRETHADEGGVPFWFSGQYASLSAVPPTPGWTLTLLPYYYNGSAEASKTFSRNGTLVTTLDTHFPLILAQPAYARKTKVFGAVPSIGLGWGIGNSGSTADLVATLPSTSLQRTLSDSVNGGTDLYPIGWLSWNKNNNNWMAYITGDVPVGAYSAQRLSNIGIGHGAIDAGGGYTYLNEKSGFEWSALAGVTSNWTNPDTNYRNGVDSHLDWAVSQFLSKSWELGVVGYVYEQLSNDSYPTDGPIGALRQQVLGGFKSGVASVGGEVGHMFKMGKQMGYLNVRAYSEFWAQNRVKGYALFGTISLPFGQ